MWSNPSWTSVSLYVCMCEDTIAPNRNKLEVWSLVYGPYIKMVWLCQLSESFDNWKTVCVCEHDSSTTRWASRVKFDLRHLTEKLKHFFSKCVKRKRCCFTRPWMVQVLYRHLLLSNIIKRKSRGEHSWFFFSWIKKITDIRCT